VSRYVLTLAIVVLLVAVMMGMIFLIAHRPPPARRALNLEWDCWSDQDGDHCVHNAPPYTNLSYPKRTSPAAAK